ncbi:hypothetical protein PCCS19_01260 [Paenibacillus sp. CCS19]|nr:hypothetical protein PCCS19_01260 [Paenibacillus cellulosilyticus]
MKKQFRRNLKLTVNDNLTTEVAYTGEPPGNISTMLNIYKNCIGFNGIVWYYGFVLKICVTGVT